MTRLVLDQGLPGSAAELLRQHGWDVLHVAECGLSDDATVIIGISALLDEKREADKSGSQEIAADHATAFTA